MVISSRALSICQGLLGDGCGCGMPVSHPKSACGAADWSVPELCLPTQTSPHDPLRVRTQPLFRPSLHMLSNPHALCTSALLRTRALLPSQRRGRRKPKERSVVPQLYSSAIVSPPFLYCTVLLQTKWVATTNVAYRGVL